MTKATTISHARVIISAGNLLTAQIRLPSLAALKASLPGSFLLGYVDGATELIIDFVNYLLLLLLLTFYSFSLSSNSKSPNLGNLFPLSSISIPIS